MPATPVPAQHQVHFSSTTIALGGASETQASSHHSGHQSQSDPQVDDPFIGSEGNIMPNTPISPTQRSEEHTSELQSHSDLVCRLLLEKKKRKTLQKALSGKIRSLHPTLGDSFDTSASSWSEQFVSPFVVQLW